MSARLFKEMTERQGGQWRTVARVFCRKCGVSESIGIRAVGGLIPPVQIAKKFVQKHWTIGQNEQWDYCPGCSNALLEKKAPMLKIVDQTKSPSQDAPREMTRDDRRIIISKLDAVYLDERRGYDNGWSDQKVATDLCVPRKWVEEIRKQNFGDVGTNEEMNEFHLQARGILDEARETLKQAKDHYDQARALVDGAPGQKALSQLSDRLGKVEKLAEVVRKYVV